MVDKPKVSLGQLQEQLDKALADLRDATEEESRVGSIVCACRGRVNALQKQLDEAMVAMRQAAPWNTEWHARRMAEKNV